MRKSVSVVIGFQALDDREVGQVLLAPRGTFVFEQCASTDDWDFAPGELEGVAGSHGLVKADSIHPIEDVDAARRQSDLKHALVVSKVFLLHLKALERGAKGSKRTINARCIVRVCTNENIQVFGGPGVAVKGDGVPPDNDKLRARVMELDQKVPKIVRQIDQVSRPGTNL